MAKNSGFERTERVYDYEILPVEDGTLGVLIHEAYFVSSSDFLSKTSLTIGGKTYPILLGSIVRNITTKTTYMYDEVSQSWKEQ